MPKDKNRVKKKLPAKRAPSKKQASPPIKFELDRFSHLDLTRWKAARDKFDEYQWTLHQALAFQRDKLRSELLDAIQSTKRSNFVFNNWQRVVPWRWSNEPLSMAGSVTSNEGGGRFNYSESIKPETFAPFGALYLGSSRKTALAEVYGLAGQENGLTNYEYFLSRPDNITILSVSGVIESFIDIRDTMSLKPIVEVLKKVSIPDYVQKMALDLKSQKQGTVQTPSQFKESLLQENWRQMPALFDLPANCQIFGELVRSAGIEGIVFPSIRNDDGECIAAFTDLFKDTGSFIKLSGPYPESVKAAIVGTAPDN